VQNIGYSRTGQVLGGRVIERSGDTVCNLHHARGHEEHGFLGGASKPRSTVCQWFGLKTTVTVFSGLASNPVATVFSGLASNRWRRFLPVWPQNGWWVSWLSLKTKVVEGFLI
jgi:hypothetical protein